MKYIYGPIVRNQLKRRFPNYNELTYDYWLEKELLSYSTIESDTALPLHAKDKVIYFYDEEDIMSFKPKNYIIDDNYFNNDISWKEMTKKRKI